MKNKKLLCGILSAAMIFTSLQSPIWAAEVGEKEDTNTSSGKTTEASAEEDTDETVGQRNLNYQDVDFKAQAHETKSSSSSSSKYTNNKAATLEKKYINPNLTDLRDQGNFGTCWAFGTMAMSEMSVLAQERKTMDLSELHMAYFMYNTATDPLGLTDGDANYIGSEYETEWYDDELGEYVEGNPSCLQLGGNYFFSTLAMAAWQGAALEEDYDYDDAYDLVEKEDAAGLPDSACYDDAVHLRNAYYINLYENPEIAKQMIKKYGSVGIDYYEDYYSYNDENNCFYQNYTDSTDHAVVIVGWDDNFSADNFDETPAGDGAWLIRNSWGGMDYVYDEDGYAVRNDDGTYKMEYNKYGHSGYFWISYYDAALANDYATAYAYDCVSSDSEDYYDNNYQYDGAAQVDVIEEEEVVVGANVFTCKNPYEELKAVQYVSDTADATVKVQVYLNPQTDEEGYVHDPESGTLYAEETTYTTTGGVYTVKLDDGLYLKEGDQYAVVVTLEKEGSYVDLYTECNYQNDEYWLDSTAAMKPGESLEKVNGEWVDLYDQYYEDMTDEENEYKDAVANIRIKAQTNNVTASEVGNDGAKTVASIAVKTEPTKTSYECTETFDPTGLVLTVTYSDNTTEDIAATDASGNLISGVTLSPAATGELGTNDQIVVTYKGSHAGIDLEVSHEWMWSGNYYSYYIETCTNCRNTKTSACKEQNITATISDTELVAGETATITVSGDYDTENAKIKYYSDDDSIASVDEDGVVTAKKAGTVSFTVVAEATDTYSSGYTYTDLITVTPSAVKGITATSSASGIVLKWTKNTSGTGYKIYRYNDSKKKYEAVTTIKSASTVTYTDKAAKTNGKKYLYKIYTYSGSMTSAASEVVTSYYLTTPTQKALSNSSSKALTVSWNRNTSASGYEIQYSTSSKFSSAKTATVSSNSTVSKKLTSLTKNKTYYVRVRSYKKVGSTKYYSAWSATKSLKVTK